MELEEYLGPQARKHLVFFFISKRLLNFLKSDVLYFHAKLWYNYLIYPLAKHGHGGPDS